MRALKKKNAGFVQPILIGAAVGAVGAFVLSLAAGALILSGTLPEAMLDILGVAVAAMGSLVAAYIACRLGQEKRLILAFGASLLLLILLAVIHALVFRDVSYRLVGSGLGVLCAGTAMGLLRTMKRERRKYRR